MLSSLGEKIFNLKYASREGETWEQACTRVARHVASVEEDKLEWIAKYSQILSEQVFIPAGRILANSGTEIKNLMNCFVLPLEDTRRGIYKTLGQAAEVFAWGGGVGYNFSNLREEGSKISKTGGTSSGPLSFMELFDQTGEVIKQASRRGAQMGMMSVDHPDIVKFIRHKSTLNKRNKRFLQEIRSKTGYTRAHDVVEELGYGGDKVSKAIDIVETVLLDNQLSHFNISVIIPDSFMEAVKNGGDWELVSPATGEVVEVVSAVHLLYMIARSAWESGDPGVFFIDRAEEDNMVSYVDKIDATNPCGEVPLLPYESCCLGSLNLVKFYDPVNNKVNWEFLEYAVRVAIRFLDSVQSISETPIEEINKRSKDLRKLGLGVMGWADLLIKLGYPYDSPEAIDLAKRLSWFISFFAWVTSMELAEERGTFALYNEEKINYHVLMKIITSEEFSNIPLDELEKIREKFYKLRNTSVTSIAPTGSIALLAGVTSSIEPIYSLMYTRNITEGVGNVALDSVVVYNELFKEKLDELELTLEEISQLEDAPLRPGILQSLEFLPVKFREIFKTAHEINWKDHIKMQSAWQSYTTNAVSKTINMPNEATVEDVYNAYILMWESKLKGGTIYRDGSKSFQILESPKG